MKLAITWVASPPCANCLQQVYGATVVREIICFPIPNNGAVRNWLQVALPLRNTISGSSAHVAKLGVGVGEIGYAALARID